MGSLEEHRHNGERLGAVPPHLDLVKLLYRQKYGPSSSARTYEWHECKLAKARQIPNVGGGRDGVERNANAKPTASPDNQCQRIRDSGKVQ